MNPGAGPTPKVSLRFILQPQVTSEPGHDAEPEGVGQRSQPVHITGFDRGDLRRPDQGGDRQAHQEYVPKELMPPTDGAFPALFQENVPRAAAPRDRAARWPRYSLERWTTTPTRRRLARFTGPAQR